MQNKAFNILVWLDFAFIYQVSSSISIASNSVTCSNMHREKASGKINQKLGGFVFVFFFIFDLFVHDKRVFGSMRHRQRQRQVFFMQWSQYRVIWQTGTSHLTLVLFWRRGKCFISTLPAGIYLLKINNRNTRARCEICSKLTIKTPERCQWLVFLVFLLLTLDM